MVLLTLASTIVGLVTLAAVAVIALRAGGGGAPAMVAALLPGVMAPFTIALPAAIRDVQRGRGAVDGDGRLAAGRAATSEEAPRP